MIFVLYLSQAAFPSEIKAFSGLSLIFFINKIQKGFEKKNILWRQHALERMLERKISRKDVSHILKNGEMIESYPIASPYPGFLIPEFPEIRNPCCGCLG